MRAAVVAQVASSGRGGAAPDRLRLGPMGPKGLAGESAVPSPLHAFFQRHSVCGHHLPLHSVTLYAALES
eukprot:14390380-Alexandrium_andersonii.AAC.1